MQYTELYEIYAKSNSDWNQLKHTITCTCNEFKQQSQNVHVHVHVIRALCFNNNLACCVFKTIDCIHVIVHFLERLIHM